MTEYLLQARLSDLTTGLRERKLSARSLLEAVLDRIERHNAKINAVVTLDADRARAAADAVDAARKQGRALPPLAGLPITLKDSLETQGMRTTCGAAQWSQHVPTSNADVVQRLVDAGCIVVGKTNTPAYAGDLQTGNTLFGVTRNPWDLCRSSGGSSGGAAAAVACGFSLFELGSDIGGSIRNPAHCCGVYGHKPSYGVVPYRGHIPPPPGWLTAPDLAVIGPIARHADDLELVWSVIADSGVCRSARPETPLRNLRLAVWLEDPDFPLDAEVRIPLERCVSALVSAGAAIARTQPVARLNDLFDDYLRLLWSVTTSHLSAGAMRRLGEDAQRHPQESWHAKLARYARVSHSEWLTVNERRQRLRARMREFFRQYDALLLPVCPVTALPHDPGEDLMSRTMRINGEPRWYWEQLGWIALATTAYLPATAAPVGLGPGGLPVGIQIVGPEGGDAITLHVARRVAEAIGGFIPPPAFAG